MTHLYPTLNSIRDSRWFKLICGASYEHIPAIANLTLAYTLAGADCIDVAADPAVVAVAREAIARARSLKPQTWEKQLGQPGMWNDPILMVSLNDAEDPHFRKAQFDPSRCPADCPRPCETICPTQAIAVKSNQENGVIDRRCYGCGRCVPICPHDRIVTRSYVSMPQIILPKLMEMGIEAIEIHTQTSHYTEFKHLWQAIEPYCSALDLIAISCPDGNDLIDYLRSLSELLHPLPCQLLWQVDGRPMSGDIGAGTTHQALRLAQKVREASLPGVVQLAGGTNGSTVAKLKNLGLLGNPETNPLELNPNPQTPVVGVAYGSYARVLLAPVLQALEHRAMSIERRSAYPYLESQPDLLWQGVTLAHSLVSQLK